MGKKYIYCYSNYDSSYRIIKWEAVSVFISTFEITDMLENQLRKFSLNARNCAVENHSWGKLSETILIGY
jgi:hypothetical protein